MAIPAACRGHRRGVVTRHDDQSGRGHRCCGRCRSLPAWACDRVEWLDDRRGGQWPRAPSGSRAPSGGRARRRRPRCSRWRVARHRPLIRQPRPQGLRWRAHRHRHHAVTGPDDRRRRERPNRFRRCPRVASSTSTQRRRRSSRRCRASGPALAGRIIDYRTQHGGFRSVDQLEQVPGLGDAKFAEIKDLVTV